MKFIKSNPHPTGKKIGDCVVRAIAIAEAKKWNDVYKALCEIGAEIHDMPNSKPVYHLYLERAGWVKNKMPKHENGRRMRLCDFADKNPSKLFIAGVVGHLTTVENGILLDTWDCSKKCIGNFYTKN